MNEQRRRSLRSVLKDLDVLSESLNHEAGGEDEAYENMPESLQDTERGQVLLENSETLYRIQNDVDCVIKDIEKLIGSKPEE
tara:strand:+ start:791 stop:1036 length:246 start_codon:yes stop_codon:yes gene_type:complete